ACAGPVRITAACVVGNVLGPAPPSYIDRNAFQSPAAYAYGNTPRTLAFDLRNPSAFNQDLSVRRDFQVARLRLGIGVDVFNVFDTVVFGGIATNVTTAKFVTV